MALRAASSDLLPPRFPTTRAKTGRTARVLGPAEVLPKMCLPKFFCEVRENWLELLLEL